MDFSTVTLPANVHNAFYVWNPSKVGGAGYVSWSTAGITDPLIAPMQSYWVQTTPAFDNQGGTARQWNMNMAANSVVATTNRPGFFKTQASDFDKIVLRAKQKSGTDWTDHTVVALVADATNGYDSEWDAYKWMNPGVAVNLYSTHAESHLANNAVSYDLSQQYAKSIPIGFASGAPGLYEIAFDANWMLNSYYLMLEDRLTGRYHDLNNSGAYTFENKADFNNRFVLHIGNQPIDVTKPSAPVDFWYAGGQVYLNAITQNGPVSCHLTDLTGREIWNQGQIELAPGVQKTLTLPTNMARGIYLLTVVADQKTYTHRIVK
jgi:hypothetical protein